ncbi:MAG: MFS transporter [Steroidobacteraceae bacterium]
MRNPSSRTAAGSAHELVASGAGFSLALLFLVSFFNYMDRYMLAVLLPSIKKDLALSDTGIGIITGFAFTIFYVTLGIPIARLADRYSRKAIISVSLAIWSLMTGLCGLAQNFVQLALARVMVGIGEAGASPPAHSLISDYFPPAQRTRAMAVFTIGSPVGITVGFLLGGWLAEAYSWRHALWAVAVPGLLLAITAARKLHEPPRQCERGDLTAVPFLAVVRRLITSPAFRHICLGNGFYAAVWLGVVQWLPSFYSRSFELGVARVGFLLAMVLGFSQLLGMLASGLVTDVATRRNARWYALVSAYGVLISTPAFLLVFLASAQWVSLAAAFFAFMLGVMQGPACFAAVQALAPPAMRATAAAILLLMTNLIGGIAGTPAAGIVSDLLRPVYGVDSLRYALLSVALLFGAWAALHYFLASRTLGQELAEARVEA